MPGRRQQRWRGTRRPGWGWRRTPGHTDSVLAALPPGASRPPGQLAGLAPPRPSGRRGQQDGPWSGAAVPLGQRGGFGGSAPGKGAGGSLLGDPWGGGHAGPLPLAPVGSVPAGGTGPEDPVHRSAGPCGGAPSLCREHPLPETPGPAGIYLNPSGGEPGRHPRQSASDLPPARSHPGAFPGAGGSPGGGAAASVPAPPPRPPPRPDPQGRRPSPAPALGRGAACAGGRGRGAAQFVAKVFFFPFSPFSYVKSAGKRRLLAAALGGRGGTPGRAPRIA